MNTKYGAARSALMKSVIGQGLPEAAVDTLLGAPSVRVREFRQGAVIFHQGDSPDELFILVSGRVHVRQDTLSGREIYVADIEESGDMFGEVYFFLGKEYDMYAAASEKTVLLSFGQELFSAAQPNIAPVAAVVQRKLLRVFAEKAYLLNRRVRILAGGSLRGKLARFLLQTGDSARMPREEMAAWLAVTRPALSRELGAMQREGLISLNGREIVIKDKAGLEEYL